MCDILRLSLIGNMIFLNNHVYGISWLSNRGYEHKILPTLYILRGKQADGAPKLDLLEVG